MPGNGVGFTVIFLISKAIIIISIREIMARRSPQQLYRAMNSASTVA